MKVTKMHGCGNDFVVIDYNEVGEENLSELTKRLCDRHFGIGADGAIFVKQNPMEFIYYNSDGSYSPFCGNGMRCFGKYCRKNKIVEKNRMDVICGEWVIVCEMNEEQVIVQIPEILSEVKCDNSEIINVCGSRHKVVEVENLNDVKEIQSDEYNLNYVEWKNKSEIKIKTIERGAGLTLACGSGSIASAWKMYQKQKCLEKILVKNAGGTVEIDVKNRKMSGPAEFVFECEVNVNALKQNESA